MSTSSLSRRQYAWDLVLALCAIAVAVAIQATGIDSVPENRAPDPLSVAMTVAAVLPLALRRRWPVPVLALCFPGFLGLIAARYSVGAAPIGALIAFYTVAAWGSRRTGRIAVVVAAAGYAVALALRPIDLSVEGLVVQLALLIGGWVIGTGTRQRKELHAVQVEQAQRQAALERERATHAAMEERLRITRELHDILGHAFSVMVVQAGVAEHMLDINPTEARRALTDLGATGRTSLAEMRRLLRVLRDGDGEGGPGLPRDPAPVLADVPALVARVRAAGLPVEFEVRGDAGSLTPGVELAAYRVIQEALTNSIKHSSGAGARVVLTHDSNALAIEVCDEGSADPGPVSTSGHGLAGMRERVGMYGGELTAGPSGSGYRVHARLPVQQVGSP